MIKSLLDKIGTLFEAEFLFGSFLPALVFIVALITTGAWVLGFEATLTWAAQRGPFDRTLFPLVLGVAVVVFAYVLSGIRPLLIRLWSGDADFLVLRPFDNVMRALERRQFVERRAAARVPNRWNGLLQWLRDCSRPLWKASLKDADQREVEAALDALATLTPTLSLKQVQEIIDREFFGRLKTFNGNSLSAVYNELQQTFADWDEAEKGRLNTLRWKLSQEFGSQDCVRPTRLGNIIEAYTSYSFTRYRIEPETFWPHLQTQIPEGFQKLLSNAGTTLDFALTSATLASVYVLLCAFAGPWLYASFFWIVPCFAGVIVAVIAYRVALDAAEQFGALFRASFDLYRLSLLTALRRTAPKSLSLERTKWEEMSRLVTYGETTDFELAAPPPAAGQDK